MSRKYSLFAVVFAFIVLALGNLACTDSPCTNCQTDSTSGKTVVFDKSSGTFVEPTPSVAKRVQQVAKDTELSLSTDKEIDRIGLGNTNVRINAWTDECFAKGGKTRQLDIVTLICEKQ